MIPFADDPIAQAGFAVNSVAPETRLEIDLLDCLANLLDYAVALDDEWRREQQARETAEAELWALKRPPGDGAQEPSQ